MSAASRAELFLTFAKLPRLADGLAAAAVFVPNLVGQCFQRLPRSVGRINGPLRVIAEHLLDGFKRPPGNRVAMVDVVLRNIQVRDGRLNRGLLGSQVSQLLLRSVELSLSRGVVFVLLDGFTRLLMRLVPPARLRP